MKNGLKFVLGILLFTFVDIFPQQIVINEIMSSNFSTIADEDGDFSDWIELFNPQDSTINLNGYALSDDPANLVKWIMPDLSIEAKDHLLVFASDKNRSNIVKHWETIINWGDNWRYRLGTSEPSTQWKNLGFNDQSWPSGPSGFGYGDDDDSTIIQPVQSLYIRKTFTVENINDISAAILHVDYDDAFVAYLNGSEIARANIGTVNIPPAYNQSANTAIEPVIVYGGRPGAYLITNYQLLIQEGENVLAIQVHNYGTTSSDMTMIPFFSLGLKEIPLNGNGTHPLLDLPDIYLHTNFKLSADGESLFISDPQGIISDQISFGYIGSDISLGRQPDGTNSWYYFSESTPGDSNLTLGAAGIAGEPVFSIEGGFYQSSVSVSLTPSNAGEIIRYSLDGSQPEESSTLYNQPVQLTSTKVLRARSFGSGLLPGRTVTNSYIINFSTQLPVISLSTNPENFFDNETGIYVLGDSAEPSFPYFGANFWKDWERPIHMEFFDENGLNGFSIDAGVKIFGGWSRGHAQKSLAIFARAGYGYNNISYKLFDDLPFTKYESIVLRNSGNDWTHTMFRDALMTGLVDDVDIDKQAYRPAVVFLNGEYWGIHNIREKVNEHFISAHHNVDTDSIDILEYFGEVVHGNNSDYMLLYNFISSNDMSISSNYEYVKSQVDVDNFIRYYVSQIYFANTDWPGANIKYWRKSVNGKWRWIMYDTDFGFGLYNPGDYAHNTLAFATSPSGPEWPNPPWSTLLLRRLLMNVSFKYDFINQFADFSNSIFSTQVVINKVSELKSVIESEIPRHIIKWNQFNMNGWNSNIQVLNSFASQRLGYMRNHFIQKFGLNGLSEVNLTINDTSMGKVKLNTLTISDTAWSGIYFLGVPVKFIAVAERGYKFVRWEGFINFDNDTLIIPLANVVNLKAIFETDENFSIPKIVINEINYNSSVAFNPEDWVELYNNSDTAVNISNWIFRDEDDLHGFVFSQGTILNANSYLVLCRDTILFKTVFPDVENGFGNTGFGLSGGGELLRLFDDQLNIIDSLTYDDQSPWPTEPDGNGPTLSLINPNLDNSLPQSWSASSGFGTPGKINDNYTSVEESAEESIPKEYRLNQNYPNPFNPVTKIRWQSPVSGWQSLKIYDILGNEIIILVSGEKPAGVYEVEFDAGNLSSGVYFYTLKTETFIQTKKMILIR